MRPIVHGIWQMAMACSLAAQSTEPPAALLLPGDEFTTEEVPPSAAGEWWVLYEAGGSTLLARAPVAIEAFHDSCIDDEAPEARSGRRVSVPGYDGVLALMRGVPDLRPGPVASASPPPTPAGLAGMVELVWSGGRSVVQGEIAGEGFRVLLVTGPRTDTLYATEWQDEGNWGVRWAGDLNRDGRLDLLLDATHKYSIATGRLFLSTEGGLKEVATFSHTGC
jgi:hypothetical protein